MTAASTSLARPRTRARAGAGEHERAGELAVRALAIGAETQSARMFAELDGARDATASADGSRLRKTGDG